VVGGNVMHGMVVPIWPGHGEKKSKHVYTKHDARISRDRRPLKNSLSIRPHRRVIRIMPNAPFARVHRGMYMSHMLIRHHHRRMQETREQALIVLHKHWRVQIVHRRILVSWRQHGRVEYMRRRVHVALTLRHHRRVPKCIP